MSKFLNAAILALMWSSPVFADPLGLGRVATSEEIAIWDIDVRPDGLGLPEGRGTVLDGEEIFSEKCAVCHGDFGEAVGRWPVLAGGQGSLTNARPVKTIGSYWPYLSTVYDYIYRAMPFGAAQSLDADEVYAITAYLLYLNNEVDEDFELSHDNFVDQRLPNEDGFRMDDRPETELAAFSAEPCMQACKPEVRITARAAVLDVTPEETAAKAAAQAATASAIQAPTEAPIVDSEMVAMGEKVFRKCKACHRVGKEAKNKVGPMLNGIVDAKAGSVEGFGYSQALLDAAQSGLIWSEAELASFLQKPKSYLKGTKMSFGGLSKEADRAAVISYLKSVSP